MHPNPRMTTILASAAMLAAVTLSAGLSGGASASAGRIAATAAPGTARFHQAAELLGDGTVLIAGGMRANGAYEASAELYDARARRFVAVGAMQARRVGAAHAKLANGNVLIAGGSDGSASALASAEIYDVAHRAFRAVAPMATPRAGAQAFALRNGKVLIVGGASDGDGRVQLASAELYDPHTDRFAPTGGMRVARSAFAGVVLNDGRVLVMGGNSAGAHPDRTIEASAEIYDPATGRFMSTGAMTAPRYKQGAALLPDGRVLVAGGSDSRDWQGMKNTTEIYNPRTGRFTRGPNMQSERFKLPDCVVTLRDGRVLVAGGAARAEIFDPASNAFVPAGGDALDGFYYGTATRLANGEVLVVGGYGRDPGAGAVAHAWLFQP